ncbi:MAG: CpsD/CapB family tyrosine-protein kinase [Streptococcaceae bacterium]|jgi:capsular exopolysaccharide synthesis family protein|nr:CpsD/CapB family tyrosine-protein kinase [Streptococcaceae bacterium]
MPKNATKTAPVPLITLTQGYSAIAEQFRTVRTNVQFSNIDKELKTLVLTSAGPSEGKSTTAANLAVVFANSGKRVLLVDADLRKPTVALTFKAHNVKGLSSLLFDRKIDFHKIVQRSTVSNLSILPSGPRPPNPSEILGSQRMEEVIRDLQKSFDLIIFDMPPVATVTDAQILSAKTDGTLLVVRERKTKKQDLMDAKRLLEIAKANVIGVVYNAAKKTRDSQYYYYS